MTREELQSHILEDITQIQNQVFDPNITVIALVYHRRKNLAGLVCFPPHLVRKEIRGGNVPPNSSYIVVVHPDTVPEQWTVIPRERGFLPLDVEMPLTVWGYMYLATAGWGVVCSGSNTPDGKIVWSCDKDTAIKIAQTLADFGVITRTKRGAGRAPGRGR